MRQMFALFTWGDLDFKIKHTLKPGVDPEEVDVRNQLEDF
jgi:hypothetical protein